jgi:hypothetical protein
MLIKKMKENQIPSKVNTAKGFVDLASKKCTARTVLRAVFYKKMAIKWFCTISPQFALLT